MKSQKSSPCVPTRSKIFVWKKLRRLNQTSKIWSYTVLPSNLVNAIHCSVFTSWWPVDDSNNDAVSTCNAMVISYLPKALMNEGGCLQKDGAASTASRRVWNSVIQEPLSTLETGSVG